MRGLCFPHSRRFLGSATQHADGDVIVRCIWSTWRAHHLIKPYAGAGRDVQQQHSSVVLHQLVRLLGGQLHFHRCQLRLNPSWLARLLLNADGVRKA